MAFAALGFHTRPTGLAQSAVVSTRARAGRLVREVLAGSLAIALASYLATHLGIPSVDALMLYLLCVVAVSSFVGFFAAAVTGVVSALAWDYFFIPPIHAFLAVHPDHITSLGAMLLVSLLISGFASRLRWQARLIGDRAARTDALYALTRDLALASGEAEIASKAVEHTSAAFGCPAVLWRAPVAGTRDEREEVYSYPPDMEAVDERELDASRARAVQPASATFQASAPKGARGRYVALRSSTGTPGALGVLGGESCAVDYPEGKALLETMAALVATALERAELGRRAEQARAVVETERLKNTLLGSVSHDLRTPLVTITGAASSLMEAGVIGDPSARKLAAMIFSEAEHLSRLVQNLVNMARLESGKLELKKDWVAIEEVVAASLGRVEKWLGSRPIKVDMPRDLPLVRADGVLLGQVFLNLLENALRHTPEGTPLRVAAAVRDGVIAVEVSDSGPGIPEGERTRIFDKFYRLARPGIPRGTGLGLAICKAIVLAHGGTIGVEDRGPGATFRFTIPVGGPMPEIEPPYEWGPLSAGGSSAEPMQAAKPST